jgi:hypothetical protein
MSTLKLIYIGQRLDSNDVLSDAFIELRDRKKAPGQHLWAIKSRRYCIIGHIYGVTIKRKDMFLPTKCPSLGVIKDEKKIDLWSLEQKAAQERRKLKILKKKTFDKTIDKYIRPEFYEILDKMSWENREALGKAVSKRITFGR